MTTESLTIGFIMGSLGHHNFYAHVELETKGRLVRRVETKTQKFGDVPHLYVAVSAEVQHHANS